ncbi:MAG: DNA polymerase III subunit gamma/tau [Geobacteraceae bacterium]|nr:DNA polymerase III subunit gamma/tau [Geobacteraceae bacterium]
MSYLVLARKWRPQTFHDLTGQDHVALTLKNAIESGRVAHAFLFTGARGVGKTSSARILAKTLNCANGPTTEPCNVCPACIEITDGKSVDVMEIDGASNNGVDEIRELRDNVKYLPSNSRYKIFIIDEVHMLSNSAFNALLKTLEEPPPHIKFIFATTEPHKVPITILSRCQRFDFKRISVSMIAGRLRFILDQEKIIMSDAALAMIARKGDGSMRDALSALDQVLAFCGDNVDDADVVAILGVVDRAMLLSAANMIFDRDTAGLVSIVAKVEECGCNMRHFCHEMIDVMRSLLLIKTLPTASSLLDISDREYEEGKALAAKTDAQAVQRCISILLKTDSEMAHSSFVKLLMEMAMIKMATLSPALPLSELLDRLKALESMPPSTPMASDSPPPVYAAARKEAVPHAVSVPPKVSMPPVVVLPEAKPQVVSGSRDWPGFVAYVKSRKPMLATKLETGKPIQSDGNTLQIGYVRGSLELSLLQEADYRQHLTDLSVGYYGHAMDIKIVPLSQDSSDVPMSIAEKKTVDRAVKDEALKNAVDSHPFVKTALEVFGGEIVAYKDRQ